MDTGSNYSCSKGHIFNDTGEISGAKRMPLPPKPVVRMLPGYVKMEIFVPENLKQALEAKFGVRVDATIVAICTSLMDPGAFVMSSEDVNQLKAYLGGKAVRHGSELMGEVFSIYKSLSDAREELEKKQSLSFSGGLMLRPSPEAIVALKQAAANQNRTVSQVATELLENASKNNWL